MKMSKKNSQNSINKIMKIKQKNKIYYNNNIINGSRFKLNNLLTKII